MIYSFVNLVSWEYFITDEKNKLNRKIFFDSLSIKILAYLVAGKKIQLYSGVDYFFDAILNSKDQCFLVANNSVEFKNTFVLPQFGDMSNDEFNRIDWNFIKHFKKVYIGISSPKQEKLAEYLQLKFRTVDFFCLGAALYVNPKKFRNSNIKFLLFLKNDFQRTIKKINITLNQIIKILFIKKVRREFREFVLYIDCKS